MILRDGASKVAEGPLERCEPTGRTMARLELPLPAPGEDRELSVTADGREIGRLSLAYPAAKVAEYLQFEPVVAEPAVFGGSQLPPVDFPRPLHVERLIGPYTVETEYYDAQHRPVASAAEPGRYGAIATFRPESGRAFRRFVTLFRTPESVAWWRSRIDARVVLPEGLGIDAGAAEAYRNELSETLKWLMVEGFRQSPHVAAVLVGLYEAGHDDLPPGWFNAPMRRDRRWWVGMKRKLYGWEQRWPQPFDAPGFEKEPAPVIREGAPAEAGVRDDAAAQIDAICTAWANDSGEPFGVCVVRRGVVVLHKAYGTRDGKPMTVRTPSRLASITKTIAGACMMMVVDAGLVDLDERVDACLPALEGIETSKPLLVRHLYTHTSGLSGHWGADVNDMSERIGAVLETVHVAEKYQYNGTGLDLGSKIIEAVTGESWPDFARNHLLRPLGCEDTTVPDCGGGMRSTPMDLARIAQVILNRGAYGRMRFFSEEAYEQMRPRSLEYILGESGSKNRYGLGISFMGGPGLSAESLGHGSATSCTLRIDPALDLVIVMTRDAAGRNWRKHHIRFMETVTSMLLPDEADEAAPATQQH